MKFSFSQSIRKYCSLLFFAFFLTNFAYAGEVKKGPNDERLYRTFQLENGLEVLLISDPSTDRSAASLDVHVGSIHNPGKFFGLAHFLEHMLFLGTEKYPDPEEYNGYLSQYGGRSNAFTAPESTNYHFSVHKDHLEGALDRFAQFFIGPLFTPSLVEREMNAVHSEHQKNLNADPWRIDQTIKSTSNPDHPYNTFTTGNLETLKTKDPNVIQTALHKFHKKYYSASIMKLVILGKEPLDELEQWSKTYFSEIKSHKVDLEEVTVPRFTSEQLQVQLDIVSIQDIRSMSLYFPIPSLRGYEKKSPTHYFSYFLGDEGPGSLLSFLKEKGWVNTLYTSANSDTVANFSTFEVGMELTEEGLNHTYEIAGHVFEYLQLIRQKPYQPWVFEEFRKMRGIGLKFQEKQEPMGYVVDLANEMQNVPASEILLTGWVFDDYDEQLMKRYLDLLTPDRMRLHVMDQNLKTDKVEKWYGTQYKLSRIPKKYIEKWKMVRPNSNLALATTNPFIPEKVVLKPIAEAGEEPAVIYDTDKMRAWFKQDDQFKTRRASWYLDIISPIAYVTPKNAAMSNIFTQLLRDSLNEYSYPAQVAGLYYNVYNSRNGLRLGLGGYDEKLPILLAKIIDEMKTLEVKKDRFEIYKAELRRSRENRKFDKAYQIGRYELSYLTFPHLWHTKDYLAVIDEVTLEGLKEFIPQLLSNLYVEMFVHGNFTKEEVIQISQKVEKDLFKDGIRPSQFQAERSIRIPEGSRYVYQTKVEDVNSSIVTQYQGGKREISEIAKSMLLGMIMRTPFYEQLRTTEQLGYIVAAFPISMSDDTYGMNFIIHSSVKDPVFLDGRVNVFIKNFYQELKEMPEAKFQNFKKSLIARLEEKPKKLSDLSGELWGEIASREHEFDRSKKMVEAIKQLNKEELLPLYQRLLLNDKSVQKISVQVFGKNHEMKEVQGETLIQNALLFRNTMPMYGTNLKR